MAADLCSDACELGYRHRPRIDGRESDIAPLRPSAADESSRRQHCEAVREEFSREARRMIRRRITRRRSLRWNISLSRTAVSRPVGFLSALKNGEVPI